MLAYDEVAEYPIAFPCDSVAAHAQLSEWKNDVWSLWEMLNLSVESWIKIGESFRDLQNPLSEVAQSGLGENREDIVRPLQQIAESCAAIQLRFSESYAMDLVEYYANKPTTEEYLSGQIRGIVESLNFDSAMKKPRQSIRDEIHAIYNPQNPPSEVLHGQITNLKKRIEDELKGRTFLGIDPGEARTYMNAGWIGEEVLNKFPGLHWEAAEAGNCFALERDTACVFHLMRILEYGLASFAESLNVPIANPNWHQVLTACEAKIKTLIFQDPARKADEPFYNNAALEFRHFQRALRNHVAHARERYSHGEAADVMAHVASFMKEISERLRQVPMPV